MSILLAAACGSDDAGSIEPPGPSDLDAGADRTSTPTDDADTQTDTGSITDAGGPDVDCGAAPMIRDTQSDDGGIACPDRVGAGSLRCTKTQECCVPGTVGAPSFCATILKTPEANNDTSQRFGGCFSQVPDIGQPGEGWDPDEKTNAAYECADNTACPATLSVCCATSTLVDAGGPIGIGPNAVSTIPEACAAKQFLRIGGTRCATSCKPDELRVCSVNDDHCPPGHPCMAAAATTTTTVSTRDLGYCAP